MRIGVDIEKTVRFRLPRDAPFVTEIFTTDELDYAYSHTRPEIHLCGMFCAKEAVQKTLDASIEPRSLAIDHDAAGRPFIDSRKNAWLKENTVLITISHCDEYAVANAVRLEK